MLENYLYLYNNSLLNLQPHSNSEFFFTQFILFNYINKCYITLFVKDYMLIVRTEFHLVIYI
jgi:hypothetical protein